MVPNRNAAEIWEAELATKAEGTVRKYREKFNAFLARWSVTPEDLFDMRMNDLRSQDPRDWIRMEKWVETQMAEIIKAGKSPSTAKQLKKAVACFFESQNLPLRIKANKIPKGDALGQKMMRPEEQRSLIDNQNRLNKKRNAAIIMTGKDSGLRVGDIQRLTVEAYEMAEVITNKWGEPFKVFDPDITKKCRIKAHIHLGPESIRAIDEYLDERAGRGDMTGISPPLFINRKKMAFRKDSMGSMISHQCKLMGKRFNKLSAHSLRKFHRTMLQKARVPNDWIDKLQGKSSDTYSRPEEAGAPEDTGELTKAYILAYDNLRIYGVPEEQKPLSEKTNAHNQIAKELGNLSDEKLEKILAMLKSIKE